MTDRRSVNFHVEYLHKQNKKRRGQQKYPIQRHMYVPYVCIFTFLPFTLQLLFSVPVAQFKIDPSNLSEKSNTGPGGNVTIVNDSGAISPAVKNTTKFHVIANQMRNLILAVSGWQMCKSPVEFPGCF